MSGKLKWLMYFILMGETPGKRGKEVATKFSALKKQPNVVSKQMSCPVLYRMHVRFSRRDQRFSPSISGCTGQ